MALPPDPHAATRSVFDMECCPLCGGKAGFTYRVTIRGTQFMPWKGSEIGAYFEDSDSKNGAYRCDDCGKIIKPPNCLASRPVSPPPPLAHGARPHRDI